MKCCDTPDIIYDGEYGKYVCCNCALVFDDLCFMADWKQNASYIMKTNIPYHPKSRHISRIHKWSNYDYYEVRNQAILNFIEEFNAPRNIKDLIKNIFLEYYKKIKTRGNIKYGLLCISIYKAYKIANLPIDIDKWFNILNITYKHYNTANKKLLPIDRIVYPININKYLDKTKEVFCIEKINKNNIIENYNKILLKHTKYNTKTIIFFLIYLELCAMNKFNKETYFKNFNISKNTLLKLKELFL
jgi:transcription initiation factor TFIIIB Brf1 subunit/transcription initiation factor TFIIB